MMICQQLFFLFQAVGRIILKNSMLERKPVGSRTVFVTAPSITCGSAMMMRPLLQDEGIQPVAQLLLALQGVQRLGGYQSEHVMQ